MRHSPTVCGTLRTVVEDTELAGVLICAGTLVLVNTFAANRDPAVYDDPDRFDISREGAPAILDLWRRCPLLPRCEPGPAGACRGAESLDAPHVGSPADGTSTLETDDGYRAGR